MNKDIVLFIEDILEFIDLIEGYLRRFKQYNFFEEIWFQDMVLRRLELIGEATKNIPESIRKQYPEVPWKKMAGMRDRLVHAYDHVDLDILWTIISDDLQPLKKQMLRIKKDLEK